MRGRLLNALILGLSALLLPHSVQAGIYPAGVVESVYAEGLTRPVQMAFAPDGRLFVTEQYGTLRVVKNGTLLPTPALTLDVAREGERGLLAVEFDPNFADNQFVYVFYTLNATPAKNRVSRFVASGDVLLPSTERVLLEYDVSRAPYHNGGAMRFGPDGKLYIALGENTRASQAQNITTLYGKMLRMNKDGSVPTDNPFFTRTSGQNRLIWAYGLRNPFSFDIHPGSGRMYINDVGDATWEEVNEGIGGSNYGWNLSEGPTSDPNFRAPVYAYGHNANPLIPSTDPNLGCSVVGATFYTPTVAPKLPNQYVGKYFFGEICNRWIRVLDPVNNTTEVFATDIADPIDVRQGPDGALYYVSRLGEGEGTGRVFRIALAGQEPSLTLQPADQTVAEGRSVTFTVRASGTDPLSYQWQRNDVAIPGATQSSYTISAANQGNNGAFFRVVVTNPFGSATSREAKLTVTAANRAPTATILTPTAGTLYAASTTVSYSGSATDIEDGTLPSSAFTWSVVFHHNTHTHPFRPPTTGSQTGSFVVPANDHTEHDVWYRITLTVRDSSGATATTFRDVFPRKSQITLRTVPEGLAVAFEGEPRIEPRTEPSVVGVIRTLSTPATQTLGGVTYQFVSWSDRGAASHEIITPAVNATYTATFQAICAANVTSQLSISRGGFRLNPTTRRYTQTITLRNASGIAMSGPLSLALDNLRSNATLYNSAGITGCSVPMGSPYANVNIGTDNVLAPNESVSVVLEFTNPSNQGIVYSTRAVSGLGAR